MKCGACRSVIQYTVVCNTSVHWLQGNLNKSFKIWYALHILVVCTVYCDLVVCTVYCDLVVCTVYCDLVVCTVYCDLVVCTVYCDLVVCTMYCDLVVCTVNQNAFQTTHIKGSSVNCDHYIGQSASYYSNTIAHEDHLWLLSLLSGLYFKTDFTKLKFARVHAEVPFPSLPLWSASQWQDIFGPKASAKSLKLYLEWGLE